MENAPFVFSLEKEIISEHGRNTPYTNSGKGCTMKRWIFLSILLITGTAAFAQNPTYEQKLYYTCKVWGFVKYYHSSVSNCLVAWDDVLLRTLPMIKNASTSDEFNDALDSLIIGAGPMAIDTTFFPDTLSDESTRNRDFSWFGDSLLRTDIKAKLQLVRDNFRPHPICWVKNNGGASGGWLAFPRDNPAVDIDASLNFPDEFTRVLILCKYWNIIRYFDLNAHVTDSPWDSTLYRATGAFASAGNYSELYTAIVHMAADLNDAHVQGLTASSKYPSQPFSGKILFRYLYDGYYVIKSGYPELRNGDRIISIDGKTMAQWEDSLRPLISAGNIPQFRYQLCFRIIPGAYGTSMRVEYTDSLGAQHTLSAVRNASFGNWISSYFANDSLRSVRWRKWGCGIGYVNMGNLQLSDVSAMYADLKNTRAILFDIRNYPNDTVFDIADLMYPGQQAFAKDALPNVLYPGTAVLYTIRLGIANVQDPYTGTVIILCNEETISHAEYSCMALQAMPKSVVVGSQTAGADGNITRFSLTRDIVTGFTTLGIYYPDGRQTQRIGIVTDSLVIPTAEGIRHGRDEVLEKALEIAGCTATVDVDIPPVPVAEALPFLQAYPNPFSTSTMLTLSTRSTSPLTLKIFDLLGREVLDLTGRIGNNTSISLQRQELPLKGIYFCRLSDAMYTRTSVLCLEE